MKMKLKIVEILMGLMTILSIPILVLNLTSGLIGGIWLAILGNWEIIIYGLLLGIVMPWVYSITLLPSLGGMLLLNFFQKHNNVFLVSVVGYLVSLFSNLTIALWVYFVYTSFLSLADQTTVIPLLLFGYSTMLSPLSYMASKDSQDSFGSTLGVLLAIVCYLTLFVVGLIGYPTFLHLVIICAIFSFITMCLISPALMPEPENDEQAPKNIFNHKISVEEDFELRGIPEQRD